MLFSCWQQLFQEEKMDRNLAIEFVRLTEAAALAAARFMSRGDERLAEQAAAKIMYEVLNSVEVHGRIVIGMGEAAETSTLYSGETVGKEHPDQVDLALDPLDGTNICATGGPNSISVIAIAPPGGLVPLPMMLMEKIVVGPRAKGAIDIDLAPAENLDNIASALQCRREDLIVAILDRPRHRTLIEAVRKSGAHVKLIGDGEVSTSLTACRREGGIDVVMGTGDAGKAVITAAGLKCLGGDFQGRLLPQSEEEKEKLNDFDPERVLTLSDLVPTDFVMFAATGVTDGDLLKGVRFVRGGATTNSIVMRSKSGTIRFLSTEHHFDREPDYNSRSPF